MMTLTEALALPDAVGMLSASARERDTDSWRSAMTDLLYEWIGDECWASSWIRSGQTTCPYSQAVSITCTKTVRPRRSHRTVSVWSPAVYVATPRTRDGVLSWRREMIVGRSSAGDHASERLRREARDYAALHAMLYDDSIRHCVRCV